MIAGAWSIYFWNSPVVHRISINSCIARSLGFLQTTIVSFIVNIVLKVKKCALLPLYELLYCRNEEEGLVFSQFLNLSRFPQVPDSFLLRGACLNVFISKCFSLRNTKFRIFDRYLWNLVAFSGCQEGSFLIWICLLSCPKLSLALVLTVLCGARKFPSYMFSTKIEQFCEETAECLERVRELYSKQSY